MVIGITIDMCVKDCCDRGQCLKAAPFLDLIAGVALLIIGILAVVGVISTSSSAGWAILGAGCCYVGLIIYRLIAKLKESSDATRHKYLF